MSLPHSIFIKSKWKRDSWLKCASCSNRITQCLIRAMLWSKYPIKLSFLIRMRHYNVQFWICKSRAPRSKENRTMQNLNTLTHSKLKVSRKEMDFCWKKTNLWKFWLKDFEMWKWLDLAFQTSFLNCMWFLKTALFWPRIRFKTTSWLTLNKDWSKMWKFKETMTKLAFTTQSNTKFNSQLRHTCVRILKHSFQFPLLKRQSTKLFCSAKIPTLWSEWIALYKISWVMKVRSLSELKVFVENLTEKFNSVQRMKLFHWVCNSKIQTLCLLQSIHNHLDYNWCLQRNTQSLLNLKTFSWRHHWKDLNLTICS